LTVSNGRLLLLRLPVRCTCLPARALRAGGRADTCLPRNGAGMAHRQTPAGEYRVTFPMYHRMKSCARWRMVTAVPGGRFLC